MAAILIQFLINGITAGCIYAIISLGFGLIYTGTKVFHIAHGAVFTTSAYVFYTLATRFHLNLVICSLLTLCFSSLLGLLLERVIYHPLFKRNASSGVILISSLGVYTFLVNAIALIYGNGIKTISESTQKTYTIGSLAITEVQFFEIGGFVIVVLFIFYFLKMTKMGKAIQAYTDNTKLASAVGIHIEFVRLTIFGIGSALAGLGATLIVLDFGITPQNGMDILLIAAVATIIGGVEVFRGTVIGAFIVGLLESLVGWQFSAQWVPAVTYALLITFLLLRPEGILKISKRLEEI